MLREDLQEFLVAFDGSVDISLVTGEVMDNIAERVNETNSDLLEATLHELEEFEIIEADQCEDFIDAWVEQFDEDE